MYYFKFDYMGIQEQMVFAEESPGEGWFEYDGEIDGNLFNLKSNKVVPMTEEEQNEYRTRIFEASVMQMTRVERNKRLMESDWTQLPTSNLSEEKKAEWEVYRQSLRDMMVGIVDFNNIKFPEPPK